MQEPLPVYSADGALMAEFGAQRRRPVSFDKIPPTLIKAFLAIDNITHTWVSDKHLAAWRMWLAHNFRTQSIAKIDVQSSKSGQTFRVTASVECKNPLKGVKLYYAFNDSADWRFATWFSLQMIQKEGVYQTELTFKEGMNLGYYVEVEDSKYGLVSSLIEMA